MAEKKPAPLKKETYVVKREGPVLTDVPEKEGSEIEAYPQEVAFLVANGTLQRKGAKTKVPAKSG